MYIQMAGSHVHIAVAIVGREVVERAGCWKGGCGDRAMIGDIVVPSCVGNVYLPCRVFHVQHSLVLLCILMVANNV